MGVVRERDGRSRDRMRSSEMRIRGLQSICRTRETSIGGDAVEHSQSAEGGYERCVYF
jgi:hypothetical protein